MKDEKKREPIKVFIGVLNQGSINTTLASQLISMVADCMITKEFMPHLRFSSVTGVEYNRNTLVKEFLKTDNEWLMMVDEDNPPVKNPLELIKLNKEVIGLPTMMWRGIGGKDGNSGVAFNAYKAVGLDWQTLVNDGEKIVEVDRVGTGCIIIRRDVLEGFKAPFSAVVNEEDGTRARGEDITFCDKARERGVKIWVNWDYICSHYKTIDLLDVAQLLIATHDKNNKIEDITPRINN